ncbi:MAG TPA: thiamine pyrophosphate-dependent dehydrogenase E1 component subunit alpha [Candidatus Limnocylindria bacterium]|jgi:TPP-dependent pyruvate/acetoin dehydrogenase alpha subunit
MTVAEAGPNPDPRLFGAPEDAPNVRLYRRMRFIRRFEETLLALFEQGVLNGTTHACVGQEADCVAVVEHLRPGDHIFSNHRCHGHYLAWTGDAVGLLAEVMGKPHGVVGGVGGSQHLCAPGFKSNGILGGTLPAAAGIALAMKLAGDDAISTVFTGDGAWGEGVVYETMNMAALWELPLLVVVENNGYSQSTPIRLNMAGDIAGRFAAFGIETTHIESTDVLEIEAAAARQIDAVRRGRRPHGLIIDTYRLCHHSKSDDNRPETEIAERWTIEPLVIHGRRLADDVREGVDAEVEGALAEIVARELA